MATIQQAISRRGIYGILVKLDKSLKATAAGAGAGLKEAGLFLQAESQKLAPVEFGNLRASAYTAAKKSGFDTVVEVGYTAAYAVFVHEAVAMKLRGLPRKPSPPHKGRYWDPQGQARAKFLEEPLRRLSPQMLAIIIARAKQP